MEMDFFIENENILGKSIAIMELDKKYLPDIYGNPKM